MRTIILSLFLVVAAQAQSARSVTLTWTDLTNPAGTTYKIFKAATPCAANPTNFLLIASGVSARTYLDSPVAIGSYCYYVIATYASLDSPRSPQAVADVAPVAPTGLGATVSVVVNVTVNTQQPQQQPQPQPQPQPQQQPQ